MVSLAAPAVARGECRHRSYCTLPGFRPQERITNEYRRLPHDGPSLSPLGLGTASFAGVNMVAAPDYRPPGPCDVLRLLQRAVRDPAAPPEDGLLMVDTSAQYGRSEELLGECLRAEPAIRQRIYLATKWGLAFDPDDFCVHDYSVRQLAESVRNSAYLLGNIDLLYLHSNPGVPSAAIERFISERGGAFELMREWKRSRQYGIGRIGVSVSSLEHLSMLLDRSDVLEALDVLQVNASLLLDNSCLAARLSAAGVSVVLNSPYRKGDRTLRETVRGRRELYHRILSRCPHSILLTGTKDVSHLDENVAHVRSWHAAPPLHLTYHGRNGERHDRSAAVEADLLRYFGRLMRYDGVASAPAASFAQDADGLSARLATVLIGSRSTRLGPAPSPAHRRSIEDRIRTMVLAGRPVDVILTWAPRKFYARGDDNRIDVCELAALERLLEIHLSVQELYPGGLRYTIFYEDFEGTYIEQEPASAFHRYRDGLESLVDILRVNDVFRIVRTSDWLESRNDQHRLRAQLDDNFHAIKAYWMESERSGIDESLSLDSCRRMNELGFQGRISAKTRTHYLRRLDRLLGDRVSLEQKTGMVIRLFACVLMHRQFDTFMVDPACDPVKFSFLQAAGGPGLVLEGRLDIRAVKATVTKRSLAPWSGRGYLRARNGSILPAMRTWREVESFQDLLVPGTIRLQRGSRCVEINADLLESRGSIAPPGTERTAAGGDRS